MTCIFCKIIEAEIPAKVVYDDDSVVAFMDIKPINAGHVLVIPKEHAESLKDVSPEHLKNMAAVAKKIAAALKEALKTRCEGVNLHLADGTAAGQEVGHIHLHVIPRFAQDGFGLRFPPHYGKIAAEETDSVHKKLRTLLEE